jgi:hypothetical protein
MIGTSGIAAAATPADCQALFQKADINKDGSLQSEEGKVFLEAMDKAQVKPADAAMVKQDEFMAACQKDAFASIDPASIGSSQTAATAEQPAATTDQSAAATTDQSSGAATTTAPAATNEQTTTATTDQSQQPATTEQSTTATTEQALAAPEGFMASDIIGATVYSGNDENLGELKDVVLASNGGQATHAIIDVGDKNVAVELSQLKIAATDSGLKVMLNASKADLDSLPAVGSK